MKFARMGLLGSSLLTALLVVGAIAAPASAKSKKLAASSVKITSAKGGVGSVKFNGSVTFNKKVKQAKLSYRIVSASGAAQKSSVTAKSKKATKTLKFSVTASTAFIGKVRVTVTALKKSSKAKDATVLAVGGGGGGTGGTIITPPPGGGPPPAQALGITAFTAGYRQTCALIGDHAYCGGDNNYDKTGANAGAATIAGLGIVGGAFASGGVTQVSTGDDFTCGLKAGAAYCWGANYAGQLGIGGLVDNVAHSFPAAVALPAGTVSKVTAGSDHACALISGAVYCWGSQNNGKLGNGATSGQLTTPVAITSGMDSGVTDIVAGPASTCAVKAGALYCWGFNKSGSFGTTGATTATPMIVNGFPGGTQVTSVAMGDGSICVLTAVGGVFCIGADADGQLGNGTPNSSSSTPAQPIGMDSGVTSIDVGFSHVCAVKSGGAFCWGDGQNGKIGNAASADQPEPVAVSGLGSGISSIGLGSQHGCAVLTTGAGYCWGGNSFYQLLDGLIGDSSSPVAVIKIVFM